MFCSQCGKSLKDGAKFCPNCGGPVRQKARTDQTPPAATAAGQTPVIKGGGKPPAPRKTIFLITGICGAAAAVIVLVLLLLSGGKLGLGQTQVLASQSVSASGGLITISDTGTALDGMELSVPQGAYAQDTPFAISVTEITSNGLGDLFNPVTPLISVENGGGFADEPMIMTIPIQKTDSEFAMAFGYDRATGELEGIPFAELKNDHITIVTAHFSDVVVSTVEAARLDELTGRSEPQRISDGPDSSYMIDSAFRPGVDDFQMPNMSDANNYGHCSGQCIAELYYFSKKSQGLIGWDLKLNGRFDNNGRGDTADLYWDDSQAIRLCAAEHKLFNERWTGYVNTIDKDTYYAFAYAIAQTQQPQLCIIRSTGGGGHAIIVYAVKGDALLVADPNFPGRTDRYIGYQDNDLKSYFSGANSQEAGTRSTEYDMFGYYGSWKLINKEVAGGPWLAMSQGEDPGAGYFPQDIPFQAMVGLDADGAPVYASLTDGMTISAQDLAAIGSGMALAVNSDFFSTALKANDTFVFYNGTTQVDSSVAATDGTLVNGTIPLQPGVNDIGILVMRQKTITRNGQTITYDGFLNFYRFLVTLTDGTPAAETSSAAASADASMVVAPEEVAATVGESVPFAAMAEGLPGNPVFVWDFGDGESVQTFDPAASHAYADPGTYNGAVFLVDASEPTMPLAQAEFVVTVFLPENAASAQPGAPAEWVNLLEDSGGVSEAFYTEIPDVTPAEVGVTRSVSLPAGGKLKVTADFASDMSSGPRFYGDELGYRAQARVYIRYNGGADVVKLFFNNGYDNEFDEIVQEVDIPSGQAVEIQIVPQGATCYPETWTPASDGNGYMYFSGQYRLSVDFLQAEQ